MNFSKFIKWLLLSAVIMTFTACGSSSSSSTTTDQQKAVAKITQYAYTDGASPKPTVEDYETAGVTGVTEDNLREVNNTVKELEAKDVNSPDQIQDIVDGLTGVGLPPPTITLNGDNPMNVALNNTFKDPGATAKDAAGNDVAVSVSGSVDTSKEGSYTLTYTATDAAGSTATETRTVNVVDAKPPVITLNGDNPMTIIQGETFKDPGATAKDADGNDLDVKATHNVDTSKAGEYKVIYTATDSAGITATETRTVNVIVKGNNPPTANPQSVTTAEDTAKVITLSGTDPEGKTLTYNVATQPVYGTLSAISGNKVTYTPDENFNGADSFTFKVNDGAQDSEAAEVSITVTAVNDKSTAEAQSVEIKEDNAVDITLIGADIDGDALTYIIVAPPTNGTLSAISDNNKVTYTPKENFNGADSFTFKVNDGKLDSNTAEVSITVIPVNDAPTANPIGDVETTESVAVDIDVTSNDTDIDGDGTIDKTTVVIKDNAGNGSTSVDNTTGVVTYTPKARFAGLDSFAYTVKDDKGAESNQATITIKVTDITPPVITLNGDNPMTLMQEDLYHDFGTTVTDNVNDGLVATPSGTVDTAKPGTYEVTYTAEDAVPNTATEIRKVVVVSKLVAKQTGQTQSVVGKDDGDYKKGEPISYADNDETVTDNATGLMWQDNENVRRSNAAAVTYCEDLTLGGHEDWRLPLVKELLSIVDYGKSDPTLDTAFRRDGVANKVYWTSRPRGRNAANKWTGDGYRWVVNFANGGTTNTYSAGGALRYVRCVRTVQ